MSNRRLLNTHAAGTQKFWKTKPQSGWKGERRRTWWNRDEAEDVAAVAASSIIRSTLAQAAWGAKAIKVTTRHSTFLRPSWRRGTGAGVELNRRRRRHHKRRRWHLESADIPVKTISARLYSWPAARQGKAGAGAAPEWVAIVEQQHHRRGETCYWGISGTGFLCQVLSSVFKRFVATLPTPISHSFPLPSFNTLLALKIDKKGYVSFVRTVEGVAEPIECIYSSSRSIEKIKRRSSFCLFVFKSLFLFVCLSICQAACLCIRMSVRPSAC